MTIQKWGKDTRWSVNKLTDIIVKVQKYVDEHGFTSACVDSIEDNSELEKETGRIDIELICIKDNHLMRVKLLILKGELLDGKAFLERIEEFYPGTKPTTKKQVDFHEAVKEAYRQGYFSVSTDELHGCTGLHCEANCANGGNGFYCFNAFGSEWEGTAEEYVVAAGEYSICKDIENELLAMAGDPFFRREVYVYLNDMQKICPSDETKELLKAIETREEC